MKAGNKFLKEWDLEEPEKENLGRWRWGGRNTFNKKDPLKGLPSKSHFQEREDSSIFLPFQDEVL